MLQEFLDLIESKCPGAKPLLIVMRGSQAYGTALPTSDVDYAGVYIQKMDDILSNKYREQINDDTNDTVFYELKRFMELVSSNNPGILELLNTPEDCIIYKDPAFDQILSRRNDFITKACANSFGGYATQQIKKAKGQNKKQNWLKEKVTRKDLTDFVYVIEGQKSIPVKDYLESKQMEQRFCGIVNVPNARDTYALFYDWDAHHCFSEHLSEDDREHNKKVIKESGRPLGLGYKGIIKKGEGENVAESNQLRLSSIPKGEDAFCTVVYNKDGYTSHCKDYREYQEWLDNRNEQRWIDVKSHGQKIDGKNMMHCRRLLEMAREIGEGKGIIVRRENAEDLIKIRKGEVDLQTLIDRAESDIQKIDEIFKNSDLPKSVDPSLVSEIILRVRKSFYGLG